MKITDKIVKEALKLHEQGFLGDLPTIFEEDTETDLSERFRPLWKACESAILATRKRAKRERGKG